MCVVRTQEYHSDGNFIVPFRCKKQLHLCCASCFAVSLVVYLRTFWRFTEASSNSVGGYRKNRFRLWLGRVSFICHAHLHPLTLDRDSSVHIFVHNDVCKDCYSHRLYFVLSRGSMACVPRVGSCSTAFRTFATYLSRCHSQRHQKLQLSRFTPKTLFV